MNFLALNRFAAYILAKTFQNFPNFIAKNGPEKMGSKTCQKMHFLLSLILLRFPPKKAKCVVSARKSRQQIGLKATFFIFVFFWFFLLCRFSTDSDGPLSGPVRDTPPYRAIPFRDSIAEGGIAPICLVFIGYRASIAEIPLWRGGIAPPLCMLSKGGNAQKGGGGIAPLWLCCDTKNPIARNSG